MFHPGYFGKVGMRHFHKTNNQYFNNTINIDKVWDLVGEESLAKAKASSGVVPVIDTLRFGYTKVLGKGRLPEVPFILKARFVSKQAEEKIVAAGGRVELIA